MGYFNLPHDIRSFFNQSTFASQIGSAWSYPRSHSPTRITSHCCLQTIPFVRRLWDFWGPMGFCMRSRFIRRTKIKKAIQAARLYYDSSWRRTNFKRKEDCEINHWGVCILHLFLFVQLHTHSGLKCYNNQVSKSLKRKPWDEQMGPKPLTVIAPEQTRKVSSRCSPEYDMRCKALTRPFVEALWRARWKCRSPRVVPASTLHHRLSILSTSVNFF